MVTKLENGEFFLFTLRPEVDMIKLLEPRSTDTNDMSYV